MGTDVLEDVKEDIKINTSDGEHDLFSHFVRKADILKARIDGIPCTALCGKKWLPTRDEENYPVCPDCKQIWESFQDA